LLLHLPVDSAIQLLQRVVQTGRLIPASFVVDQPTALVPIEVLRLGVQDYVTSQYITDDILQLVRRILGRVTSSLNFEQLTEDLTDLNQNLEQRIKHLGAIKGTNGSTGLQENLDSVLNRVTETAVSVTGADTGYLFLFDDKTDVLRLRAAQNLSQRQVEAFAARLEEGVARSVVRSGKPILLSRNGGNYLELKTNYLFQSLLNVPLKVDEQVIGVLGVDNLTATARFSLVDLRRVTELAEMAATAVINTRQYTEAREEIARHLEEVATLQAMASRLSGVTDFNKGAQLALSSALKSTNAEAGVLAWLSEENRGFLYVLQGNLNGTAAGEYSPAQDQWWDEQILQEVVKSGQPNLSYDLGHGGNGKQNKHGQRYARSRLTVPMRRGNKVVGAINLESAQPTAFTQDDLQFVSRIADQVVVALEGAVLQEKAELERHHLSMMMAAVDNGVILVDAHLRLMALNEAASEMVGWSEVEVVGRSVCEFEALNGDSPQGLYRLLHQAIETQQRFSYSDSVSLKTKSGPAVPVNVRIVPVVRDEKVLGAICAFRLSKMSDEHVRFEFANMASHLLRTPLTSIQASVDVLLNSQLDSQEQRAMLDQLREQSQRMREFVKELLEMSRLEAGIVRVYAEPVPLSPLLDRVLSLMRSEEPQHKFSLNGGHILPIVAADLSKTELVLVNLLRNAASRCSDGGHVIVKVETKADEVIISIGDNGEAIPVALLDRIFSQFYPIDSTSGTMMSNYHLGLYSTKRLIELQNGRVWVESLPARGSCFSFSLPIWR
jgi:PAS domain S-box-containing protein